MQEICSSINCKSAPSQVSWSQGGEDVEVHIALPKGVKGRDISVTIKYNWIKFGLKNGHSMPEESDKDNKILQGLLSGQELYRIIDADLSTWTLADGQLVITLQKRKEEYWRALYAVDDKE